MTIFIFGFGQVSKELAKKISNDKKIDFKIVSRNTQNFLDYVGSTEGAVMPTPLGMAFLIIILLMILGLIWGPKNN
mgnify:CR=1 FL=1